MRIDCRIFLLAFATGCFATNAFARSVIMDAAYYRPEVPKQLAVDTSYEEINICQTATSFAVTQRRLDETDNLTANASDHYDFWNATSTLHAEQNSYALLSDASLYYFIELLKADESYVFTNEDIVFLAKRGSLYSYEHKKYIYDNFFESCEAKVQRAKLEAKSDND